MRPLIFSVFIILIVQLACSRQPAKESEEEHHEESDARVLEISKEGQQKAGLEFVEVQQVNLQNELVVTGKVVPDESRVVHIRPLAAGRVEKVFVQPGSEVKDGQPLLSFDYVELGELENEYFKARAKASVSEQALKRAENLVKIGAIAESEYERRRADHQDALASIKDIEVKASRYGVSAKDLANLKTSSHTLGHSILRAPRSGVLLEYKTAAGEMAHPELDLFTIGDLTSVWVEANVHESNLSMIEIGRQVDILSDAYPQTVFRGQIVKIGDVLDVATRTIKVRCQVPNKERKLKLEMFVNVVIPTSATRDALVVPADAVQEIADTPVVFVREGEDHFEKRDIKLGEKTESGYEVLSGLKKGEMVVAQGSFSLKSEFLKAEIGADEHGH